MKRLLIRIEVYDELLEGDFLLAVPKHYPTISPEEEDKAAKTIDIDAVDTEDDDPSFLYDWINPS